MERRSVSDAGVPNNGSDRVKSRDGSVEFRD